MAPNILLCSLPGQSINRGTNYLRNGPPCQQRSTRRIRGRHNADRFDIRRGCAFACGND